MKIYEVIGALVVIVVMVGLLLLVAHTENKTQEVEDCLKPLAISVCEERGETYSQHTVHSIFCKEDIRGSSHRVNYLSGEVKECVK